MEILTYPIGLVFGILPVVANLGGPGAPPAQLLLDGRVTCTMTAEAPRCDIDLGPDLRVHLLELVRAGGDRGEERVRRWVNKPGAQAELFLRGGCDAAGQCSVTLGWAHPAKLEPRSLVVTANGEVVSVVSKEIGREFRFANTAAGTVVVSAEAIFPDGRRATVVRPVGTQFQDSAETLVDGVPIVLPENAPAPPTIAGLNVRSIERGPADVAFVVEPGAMRRFAKRFVIVESEQVPSGLVEAADPIRKERPVVKEQLRPVERMTAVVPDERLGRFKLNGLEDWIEALSSANALAFSGPVRLNDAVASAGMLVAGTGSRRAVVLVISGDHRDGSALSTSQVRRFLADLMVPLLVWRTGKVRHDAWPDGTRLERKTLVDAARALRADLEGQRIAWLEGGLNPSTFVVSEADRVKIAGRTEAVATLSPR